MADDRYTYLKVPEEHYYEFYSEGPKGVIKKIIRYSLIEERPYKIYNLGFGDWDEKHQDVDDLVNSNNDDRQKVLGTVADTVIDFLNNHPHAAVFAKGSTAARTRLYQMNILAYWEEITEAFYLVQGYLNEDWQPFEKGINFEAFIIRKKF
ncbi:DUF6934 family protein [Parapedobacter koreensis]|uniref:Uncharacterized protein n=1 Tax=Parapedobacter koreensis TaxID=332977 RepID=A0A1H7ULN8_9SPHI|nr:hypothetical protein [Parapedobacter koreensis]SEL97930.1 hypothetical protein SAMN05421740_11814 [Parapedobacter koreensis]